MIYIRLSAGRVAEIGEVADSDWDTFVDVKGDSYIPYTGDRNYIYVGGVWNEETQQCERPEPPPEVIPTITADMVITKVDNLREKYITDYIAIWGTISKQNLWPLLERELNRVDTDILEVNDTPDRKSIAWPKFPSLRGYIGARLGKAAEFVTDDEVRATATALQNKKAEHTRILTMTEMVRSQILGEFNVLTTASEKAEYWNNIEVRWGELTDD